MDNTTFANNLRQLRLDKNYTQEQVAHASLIFSRLRDIIISKVKRRAKEWL